MGGRGLEVLKRKYDFSEYLTPKKLLTKFALELGRGTSLKLNEKKIIGYYEDGFLHGRENKSNQTKEINVVSFLLLIKHKDLLQELEKSRIAEIDEIYQVPTLNSKVS